MKVAVDGVNQRWRRLALCSLAGWATVLTVETLVRPPGFAAKDALPPQLGVGMSAQKRRPIPTMKRVAQPRVAQPKDRGLPPGVVELEVASYGRRRLRLLGLMRSGGSGTMPVEAINAALTGSRQGGRCLVLNQAGVIVAELENDAQWLKWRRDNPISPLQTLQWLAGLRPHQSNHCVWDEGGNPRGES